MTCGFAEACGPHSSTAGWRAERRLNSAGPPSNKHEAYGAAANNCRSRGLKFASDTGEIVPDSTQAQSIIAKTPTSPTATARVAICLPRPRPTASSHAVSLTETQCGHHMPKRFSAQPRQTCCIKIPSATATARAPFVTLAGTTYNVNNERRSGDASFDAAWLFMNAAFFCSPRAPAE